jgi:hypothetical protein
MMAPNLVIDEKVKLVSKTSKKEEIAKQRIEEGVDMARN